MVTASEARDASRTNDYFPISSRRGLGLRIPPKVTAHSTASWLSLRAKPPIGLVIVWLSNGGTFQAVPFFL